MKLNELRNDERAVSPVVGVALLIAMAVILAAVIGTAVLGLGSNPTETPQASFSFETESDGNVTITHDGGDTLDTSEITIKNESDVEVTPDGDTWTAGQTEEIGASTDETVRVIWEDSESDKSAVLGEYTA